MMPIDWHEQPTAAGESLAWGQTLKHVAWRVDVASKSRHTADVGTASAIVELTVGAPQVRIKQGEPGLGGGECREGY